MLWYKIILTSKNVSENEHTKISKFIGELVKHLRKEDSKEIVVLSKWENLYRKFIICFSPKAFELGKEMLEVYDGTFCNQPTRYEDYHFSAGDNHYWNSIK